MADVWALGSIMYYLISGEPLNYAPRMQGFRRNLNQYRGINKGCTRVTKADDPIKNLVSAECFDFLSKLLHPIGDKRLKLHDAWRHPWLWKFRDKISDIPRPLALDSIKSLVSSSFVSCQLFHITASYILRSHLPRPQSNAILSAYLYYDRAKLGTIQVSDMKRILLEGGFMINDADLLVFLRRLGLESLEEDIDQVKLNGFSYQQF